MSAAALTPRVRFMVVCAEVIPSDTENGVFTLVGVRQHLYAESFPCWFQPNLFLLLSSPRKGTYPGTVLLIQDETARSCKYVKFDAVFEEDNVRLPMCVDLGPCEFPDPGQYTFQVYFSSRDARDVLKAEQPFDVLTNEE